MPLQFQLDETQLRQNFLTLQNSVHPDRYASASEAEKRKAVQWSTRINEAYHRLKNPSERAFYWCLIQGHDLKKSQSQLPTELLMQHMEWREALEEIKTLEELETLLSQINAEKKQTLKHIQQSIDTENNLEKTIQYANSLMFINKFIDEIKKKIQIKEEQS